MKKALVSYQGFVSQIVDPGEDFEIYEGPDATIAWVDAPDNVQKEWTLEWSPSQRIMLWVEREGAFTSNEVARKVAYGEIGAQLGAIFDDIKEHGALTPDGAWYQHIVNVKSVIDRPVYQAPVDMEELMILAATREPSVDNEHQPSTMEMPSWKRYPGWKGYSQE
jgi:hypothetical protein